MPRRVHAASAQACPAPQASLETPAAGHGYRRRVVSNATVWVRERLATAPAIYGLIVYDVLIAATSDYEPDTWSLLIVSLTSLIVFYLAHAFSEAVAAHGSADKTQDSVDHGLRRSAGMLYAGVLPTLALILCALLGVRPDDAGTWALIVGLAVLAYLGYQATAERGRGFGSCLLGGFLTALLGLGIMLLDYLVH